MQGLPLAGCSQTLHVLATPLGGDRWCGGMVAPTEGAERKPGLIVTPGQALEGTETRAFLTLPQSSLLRHGHWAQGMNILLASHLPTG